MLNIYKRKKMLVQQLSSTTISLLQEANGNAYKTFSIKHFRH